MPQSATITVLDRQRVSDKPKAPYKIETTNGDVFKAWPDVGEGLRAGETYNISYEAKTNGNYTDNFIKSANKSTDKPTGSTASNGGNGPVAILKAPVVDWAAKEEDMATLAIFKASYAFDAQNGLHLAQCLDNARMEWRAHKVRTKAPKAPVAAPKSMAQPVTTMNDWVEDTNDPAFPD